MRRFIHIAALAAVLPASLLVGCGNDDPTTSPGADAAVSAPSASAGSGEVIPDGTYAKTATLADAKALGVTDKSLLDQLGTDGATTYSYKIAGNRWTLFLIEEGAAPEPGDGGNLEYDDQGDVSMLSESDGCPGCIYVYEWQLDGDRLTLTIVGHEASDTPEDLAAVRFVTEGVFEKQS